MMRQELENLEGAFRDALKSLIRGWDGVAVGLREQAKIPGQREPDKILKMAGCMELASVTAKSYLKGSQFDD